MNETAIRNSILTWMKHKGAYVFIHDSVGIFDLKKGCFRKRHGAHRILGISDIIGLWKGRFLAIEVKSATGRLSQFQEIFLDEINQWGGIAFMARSIEDVELQLKLRGLM